MFFISKFLKAIILISFLGFLQVNSIRFHPKNSHESYNGISEKFFMEAPDYKNGDQCPVLPQNKLLLVCNPSIVHIAMTLDPEYLRGTMAAVHSVLKHTSCPENVFFHFIGSDSNMGINLNDLTKIIKFSFPSLSFKVYIFKENLVNSLISSSIRQALDNPLNYARSYLTELLDPCVDRVIYLDSDVIVVDDIQNLWKTRLPGSTAIGAPEYCQADFKKYFSDEFWSEKEEEEGLLLSGGGVFAGRRKQPCYFNTGVMVMDLEKWRKSGYTKEIEKWMRIQKEKRIYELGSLPPFLLVFGGEIEGIDHKWNQHGLGGDNVVSNCRELHPGPVSLLHWSGKGKPWVRLDGHVACPVDFLWQPYDLAISKDLIRNAKEIEISPSNGFYSMF